MVETDIIGHLIDIEHQASSMVLDAQVEADQRIAEARAKADILYKEGNEQLVTSLEAQTADKIAVVKQSYDTKSKDFSQHITKTPKDIPAFDEMLKSLLFKAD